MAMKLHLYLFTAAGFITANLLLTTHVNAEVYKCTFEDSETSQNKVVYSDEPCNKSEKQTLTTIQLKSPLTAPPLAQPQALQAPPATQLAQAELDAAVTRAVLNRDFKLAKSLAVTKEHQRLISIAEDKAMLPPEIVAHNQAVVAREAECAQAKDNFEVVSRTSWRDKDLVAAKKSIMYAACGIAEPVQNPPVFVGRAYRGFGGYGSLHSGRWSHPYHVAPHQSRPHRGVGHQAYPVKNNHHGHNLTGGSANLSYKSKHFSINAESANVR
jgi:hypothetical protein